ncbi:NucA/NucB deoxyribonuclease domain-containing protein [Streptomyces lunaelactis]|uniref:NucA/NucB deoxyribonuclease domain-containing protein n=1 Tax=Streptomyces lunaelactis TaxID=1535768 RepID=UPI0020C7BE98|nr:NucA/NucB deoxyribonuclease domain-containing protein [Streptomyces lunaelactis]
MSMRRLRDGALAATAVLMAAMTPAASAEDHGDLERVSYVLPLGIAELEGPVTADAIGVLGEKAELVSGGMTALETVGPVAGYAPRAATASAAATPAVSRAQRAAPAAVSYPAPARSISLAECQAKIDRPGGEKFYVKSRFAVCTGIRMTSTWSRNGAPVGTSETKVFIRGTVPKEADRTMKFDYDVVGFKKVGAIPTDREMYRIEGTIPKVWPASARKTQGGNLPVTKSFDALRAMPSAHFIHTVRYAPGQGTGAGAADVVFAVYQPVITASAVPGWIGAPSIGKPFMLAPRWDAAKYLNNPTGGSTPANKGSASFSYLATLHYSTKATAPERGAAGHIKKAFTTPKATQPPNGDKRIPGQSVDAPLHRLYLDAQRRKDNRAKALSNCRRYFGPDYTQGGKDCDEYPFATTYEGAAQADHDPHAEKLNFSVLPVDSTQNQNAGRMLGQFLTRNRIIDGPEDGFLVKISS